MAKHSSSSLMLLPLVVVVVVVLSQNAAATVQVEKDCADKMQDLAPCIAYVSGSAKKPSPDCCSNAEKVRSQEPKCLCLLILRSTNASLAFPVNTTLALDMPAACNSDAKVSECPSILKLEPGSPEAKIFEEGASTGASPSSSSDQTAKGALASGCESLAVGLFGLIMVHIALLTVIV